MSERIAEVLRTHEWKPDYPGCNIGECAAGCAGGDGGTESFDDGYEFTYDGHLAHVAAAVQAALNLTEETERVQCDRPECTWSYGCGHDGLRSRDVTPWRAVGSALRKEPTGG